MPKHVPNILIVDDNSNNIDFLLGLLIDYDITVAVDGESALEQVNQDKPDLILLDVNMPVMDGYEVCSIIKSNSATKDIPILFLSAYTDAESIVKSFDVGGIDYITKPYLPREILARVETHLKLKKTMDDLEKMANEDPLSGIANRRRFFENANILFNEAKSENLPIYLFAVDIDKFKVINDIFGHDVGDEVIKKFVDIVKKELSNDEVFARYGGDEFIIMAMKTNQEKALDLVKRIQDNISNTHILLGIKINFAVSIGISKIENFDKNIDTLIKRADINLYKEKQAKKKQIR